MHGRLKVKTTAEQAEAKQKERQKKLQAYQHAMKLIFTKRTKGELDKELLAVSEGVLLANPDIYTLWNIRRETFLYFLSLSPPDRQEDVEEMYSQELRMIESCLRVNPKSYGCWHQRSWVMRHMEKPDWTLELKLCNKFLEYDERNFHCWDYRRFVVSHSHVSAEQELEFTTKKITTNFSNYSSWHYRSKLLTALCNQGNSSLQSESTAYNKDSVKAEQILTEEVLLKELVMVQNAFFTDPDDQSAWFYQRWLLGKGSIPLSIRQAAFCRDSQTVIVTLTKPISVFNGLHSMDVYFDNEKIDGRWSIPINEVNAKFSDVWLFRLDEAVTMVTSITIELRNNCDVVSSCVIPCHNDKVTIIKSEKYQLVDEFSMSLTSATREVLTSELNSCLQLHELEPDNKWALLTVVLLMATIDLHTHLSEMCSHLETLQSLDIKRRAYYQDLRSRFIIENSLSSSSCQHQLILSGKQLTSLFHPSHMTFFSHIDQSNNRLRTVKYFDLLQLVENLNLDNNEIHSLDTIFLPRLKTFSIQNNYINDVQYLSSLSSCSSLQSLHLAGNPVCDANMDYCRVAKTLVPSLVAIDGVDV